MFISMFFIIVLSCIAFFLTNLLSELLFVGDAAVFNTYIWAWLLFGLAGKILFKSSAFMLNRKDDTLPAYIIIPMGGFAFIMGLADFIGAVFTFVELKLKKTNP